MPEYSHIHDQPEWFNQRLSDGGPVYTETNPDHFIVEPWNAVSSLLIVLPAIYWLFRIRHNWQQHRIMLVVISLMILGGTGSALFHAFRASRIFLIMDVLPAALLTLVLTVFFWQKVIKRWHWVLGIVLLSVGLRFFLFGSGMVSEFMAINLSYLLSGLFIGLPLVLLMVKLKSRGITLVIFAIGCFILAILFREYDTRTFTFLPMGTHFLWHAFSGVGAWFILAFLHCFRADD